jgi:hypothetical protein
MDDAPRNGFLRFALGIGMSITVIIDHGDRNLHGGVRGNYQRYDVPGEVRPGGKQREDSDSHNVKQDRNGMAEQVKAQEYVVERALFSDLHGS